MKNPERVAELLAELRELAENDFERHRIGVLKHDLHDPPKVEIVDDTHQRFNGVAYRAIKEGHYQGEVRLHRAVYEYFIGTIPKGHDIHHIDRDKANNTIDNLQCLTRSEHRKLHNEEDKITIACLYCGKIFNVEARTDNNGYCSSTCRIAHRYRLDENQTVRICQHCGKEFVAYKYSRVKFCSDACRYAGVQSVKKICPVCGKEFEHPTWRDNKCCSHCCAAKLMWQTARADDHKEIRQCACCGKNFPVRKSTQRFCSKSCAVKYRYRGN